MFNKKNVLVIVFTVIFSSVMQVALASSDFNLSILHTNDVHGRLAPINYSTNQQSVGGIARRATLIKNFKEQNKNVLVLDAGDVAQGTLFYKTFHGVPDMKIMSEIGYDASTLGNHEFDSGLISLQSMIQAAKFPVLAANIDFSGNKYLHSHIKKYIIKDFNGFKVAIIGVTTSQLNVLTNVHEGIKVNNDIKTANELAKKLRNQVDIIIVLSHMGVDQDIKLAKLSKDIDIIVGGHSHTFLMNPVEINNNERKTIIVQDGEFGIYLGDLNLEIKNDKIVNYTYKSIPVDSAIKENKHISEEVKALSQEITRLNNEKVGYLKNSALTKEGHSSSQLTTAGALVAGAVRAKFPDVDVIMVNSGSVRKSISAGDVSKADVYELYPFDNKVCIATISGKYLKSLLETSSSELPFGNSAFMQTDGIEYSVNLEAQPQILSKDKTKILKTGKRVFSVKIKGTPIKYNKYYTVAISDFIFDDGDGYFQFKHAKSVQKTKWTYQDLIFDYLDKNSPLDLEIKDKINIIK